MKTDNVNHEGEKAPKWGYEPYYPFTPPTGDEISIVGLSAVSPIKIIAKLAFKTQQSQGGGFLNHVNDIVYNELKGMAECGINLSFCRYELDYLDQVFAGDTLLPLIINYTPEMFFSSVKKADMKLLISSFKLTKASSAAEFVKKYKSNSYIGAWFLVDEPIYERWHNVGDREQGNYVECNRVIRKADPDRIVDINLSLSTNEHNIGPHANKTKVDLSDIRNRATSIEKYKSYLKDFENSYSPNLWSYDQYPFHVVGEEIRMDRNYYFYLDMFSKLSAKTETEFWTYNLSMQVKVVEPESTTLKARPTPGLLRFTSFSALAYGAKGIVYWDMRNRKDDTSDPGYLVYCYDAPYINVAKDSKGNIDWDCPVWQKTDIWDFVKEINSEIRKYSHVFMESIVEGCWHAGEQYVGTVSLAQTVGPLGNVQFNGKGVLISHLKSGSTQYIVIVSHDAVYSQIIRLDLIESYNPEFVTTGQTEYFPEDHIDVFKHFIAVLKPGGYVIIKWETPGTPILPPNN